ncbi:MAG: Methyltransferase domain protein [Betaproteobacteria bacterium ADurb.Bin341]|nr:MAG: Methyltransferase domain protein [Betaproteobacteria bacterium ADurb.Bin341]
MQAEQKPNQPVQLTTDALADRCLPQLRPRLEGLPPQSLVADFGAGRGRHSLYALRLGHSVLAVEKRADTFADLKQNLERSGVAVDRFRLVEGDYLDVAPLPDEQVNLLVMTGVLQHCVDRDDLIQRLTYLGTVVSLSPDPSPLPGRGEVRAPLRGFHNKGGMIYIEMLFNMKFDGQPKPGRVEISVQEFERLLPQVFPPEGWNIERVAGPVTQTLDFSGGGRSFISEAKLVEQTAAEYVLTRRT